jgi:hypothetical protein
MEKKIMYGNIYGLSPLWGIPEITDYVVTKEKGDLVWVKGQYETLKIKKKGNLFNTHQEAVQYMVDIIQAQINSYLVKSDEIKNNISEIQNEINIIQVLHPDMKIISFAKEKISELQKQHLDTKIVLDGFQSSMDKIKEKYQE